MIRNIFIPEEVYPYNYFKLVTFILYFQSANARTLTPSTFNFVWAAPGSG